METKWKPTARFVEFGVWEQRVGLYWDLGKFVSIKSTVEIFFSELSTGNFPKKLMSKRSTEWSVQKFWELGFGNQGLGFLVFYSFHLFR
jgi:hypothetical protein